MRAPQPLPRDRNKQEELTVISWKSDGPDLVD
jgi:hypothetical protein